MRITTNVDFEVSLPIYFSGAFIAINPNYVVDLAVIITVSNCTIVMVLSIRLRVFNYCGIHHFGVFCHCAMQNGNLFTRFVNLYASPYLGMTWRNILIFYWIDQPIHA